MRQIKIFDTTLRDGAQSASAKLKLKDKAEIAKQLERLNVDVIEAGFPASLKTEQDVVKKIAEKSSKIIAALTRAKKEDVEAAWQAICKAKKPRFHIFIASSDEHMQNKLHMTKEQVINAAVSAIKHAKLVSGGRAEIEFSAEDATRSEERFLFQLYDAAIKAGASIINIPDTVGFSLPNEFFKLVYKIRKKFPAVELSVHCHNDLGMAVANSLAAIHAGINQIHCTVNGVGERAGNASLEEIATALYVRRKFIGAYCNVNLKEISKTSEMISKNFGIEVPHYKAVVGKNALRHEAGIHVQYFQGYEIFTPETIGGKREIILGKHSGIHTVREIAKVAGVKINEEEAKKLLEAVKKRDLKINEKNFRKFKAKII